MHHSLESMAVRYNQTLQMMHNKAITRSQQAARLVYNRESRNIAKFIKEKNEFDRKTKQQPFTLNKHNDAIKKKRFGTTLRYEENQELQLEFPEDRHYASKNLDNIQLNSKQGSEYHKESSAGFKQSKVSFTRSGKIGLKFCLLPQTEPGKRNKAFSVSQPKQLSPGRHRSPTLTRQRKQTSRRRVITQFELTSVHDEGSVSLPKHESYSSQISMIVMNKEKMERYIRNLHRVAWMAGHLCGKGELEEHKDEFKEHMRRFSLDKDAAIQSGDLNYMVARRYNLLNYYLEDLYDLKKAQLEQHEYSVTKQQLAPPEEYPLLDSLSKHSILCILTHKFHQSLPPSHHRNGSQPAEQPSEKKVLFNLPYAEFISERQTKISIYRLTSMNTSVCLRLAFSLYDKNHNGKVDEDDLLQAISLSRKMPQLESDIACMANVMLNPKRFNSFKTRSKREQTDAIRTSQPQTISEDTFTIFSPKKNQDSSEGGEEEPTLTLHSKFALDKFYVFMKEREQSAKREVSPIAPQQIVVSLNYQSFCRAFHHRKPAILYDLLHYLLGAHKQDFIQSEQLLTLPKKPSPKVQTPQQQSLEQKWNNRLKQSNAILHKLVSTSNKY